MSEGSLRCTVDDNDIQSQTTACLQYLTERVVVTGHSHEDVIFRTTTRRIAEPHKFTHCGKLVEYVPSTYMLYTLCKLRHMLHIPRTDTMVWQRVQYPLTSIRMQRQRAKITLQPGWETHMFGLTECTYTK